MFARKPSTHAAWPIGAVAFAALLMSGTAGAAQPTEWIKGRVIVETRAGLSGADLARVVAPHGGSPRQIGSTNLHIVDLPANASETAVAAMLAHHPHLKFAELDRVVKPTLVTNDPYLGSEWHLAKFGASTAWDTSKGAGVTIAIIDTGVDPAHPDLVGALVPGWNFYDNNANSADVYGHGTKVAGAAAAVANNGIGAAGVAGGARLMPIRISDTAGGASLSAMAQGLTWAADHGARVANISYVCADSATVLSAAAYMKSKGGLVTTAAGNYGTDAGIAQTPSMIPVSSTGTGDTLSSWSSFGSYVALAAPGEGIYTTVMGGGYGAVSGTSFASPVTAGVVALMMAARPTLSSATIESTLYATALDLGAAGRDIYYGHGRVNASAAVAAILTATGPVVDATAPSVSIAAPLGASTVSGLVAVDVSASDNVGISRVELWVNGKLLATDTAAPYGFSWNSASAANGINSLYAKAYDAAGNVASSSTLLVNVANVVVADTIPPVVTISNPTNGAKVTGTVQVSVAASDNMGVASLKQRLMIDGKVVASATGGALSYNWNTRKLASGNHQVQAVATDAAGNQSISTVLVSK